MSAAVSARRGDRVTLIATPPRVPPGVVWVLLDHAPLTRYVPGVGDVRTTNASHGRGRAWWLQDATTGAVSSDWLARESIMVHCSA